MKNTSREINKNTYVTMKFYHFNLYDIKLRIEFDDMLDILKSHPMSKLGWLQFIRMLISRLDLFVLESDQELLLLAYDTLILQNEYLKREKANEILLNDYIKIMNRIEKLMNK